MTYQLPFTGLSHYVGIEAITGKSISTNGAVAQLVARVIPVQEHPQGRWVRVPPASTISFFLFFFFFGPFASVAQKRPAGCTVADATTFLIRREPVV